MIRGITKPITPEALALPDEQRRTAAGLYVSGIDRLFTTFDPEAAQSSFCITVPYDQDSVKGILGRGITMLMVFAPDSQTHTYAVEDDGAVWRADGTNIRASFGSPPDEKMSRGETPQEELARIKAQIADEEALEQYAPTRLCVDPEEVNQLIGLLMQGEVAVVPDWF